ncbi:MAG TPA: hypothetical protein DCS07_00030 [Bdellovibrionales bacterium]|nr:MAG: hypothetical protein A2X97_09685 [Bdellovibrionales bacterium GWA1_52_35]OFZ41316.1 MAG: hypothetical protein A2070_09000 [Bdellovibrionales bacterium GWC1_52_8]HAR41020.1 hypothetical protein [Bdellovibrionales bacterium]HCM40427.1 hypothetical protein [Bdellovibrionales bacterium]
MRRVRLLFFVVMLFGATVGWTKGGNWLKPAYSPTDAPWLAQITSEFTEDHTLRPVSKFGAGTVVQINEDLFLLTASHISQGEHTRARIAGQEIDLEKAERLADNLSDIELIKLPKLAVRPAARWNPTTQTFDATPEGLIIPLENRVLRLGDSIVMPVPSWIKREDIPEDWKDKKLLSGGLPEMRKFLGGLTFDQAGKDCLTDTYLSAGMSGAPVFEIRPGSATGPSFHLSCIAKNYLRYFPHSYLAGPARIAALVGKFQSGQRKTTDATRWRIRKCLMYRNLGDGTLEVNPLLAAEKIAQSSKFKASVVPVGGGGGTDGGGGGGTDGGGGNGCSSVGPTGIYEELQLKPGMQWKGKSAIAFKVGSEIYDANLSNLIYLKERNKEAAIEPITDAKLIGTLIRNRTRSADLLGRSPCRIDSGKTDGDLITVTITVPVSGFFRRFFGSTTEKLKLKIDSKGRVNGAPDFIPIVQIKGPISHALYTIDLRGLYATDLSRFEDRLDPFHWETRGRPHLVIQGAADRRDTLLECENSRLMDPNDFFQQYIEPQRYCP